MLMIRSAAALFVSTSSRRRRRLVRYWPAATSSTAAALTAGCSITITPLALSAEHPPRCDTAKPWFDSECFCDAFFSVEDDDESCFSRTFLCFWFLGLRERLVTTENKRCRFLFSWFPFFVMNAFIHSIVCLQLQ